MTREYICRECKHPCYLQVDDGDLDVSPSLCPFAGSAMGHWMVTKGV